MKQEGSRQLFTDFPEITTTEWEEKILADLKGADYKNKLVWKTEEGIDVKPFYRQEDLESLDYLKGVGKLKRIGSSPNGWTICQDIFPGRDLKEANEQIKTALKGGVEAIRIQFKDTHSPNRAMLESLLEDVPLGETELIFQGYLGADVLYDQLCELARSKGINPFDLKGSLGADPLGKMMSSGIPIASMENLGKLVRKVRESSPEMRVIDVNGAFIHNAGSTLVEEVAFAMSMASDYMDLLTGQGIDPLEAQNSIQLNLAAGPNFFMEVAKLRSVRILWAKISEAYGVETSNGIRIHSTSSEWNMTLYDPYVNMLRGTTEAISSILGGADLLSVLPFDYPYGKSSAFSDRIARSVQIIIRDEAYMDRVADPASGSYYIENLTDSIGEKSWELFCEVEAKGGFKKAFEKGWIQEQVGASLTKKLEIAASGKRKILGTNAYPNLDELILDKFNKSVLNQTYDSPLIPLKPYRLSAIFEEVRFETERSDKRPRVLTFKYGNPAWRRARATFSGNLFACAGYEILDQPAFATVEEGILAAKETNADIIVLCSSDDAYEEMAHPVLDQLKNQAVIVVAGYPAESLDNLRKAGIEHFIHNKSNLLEILKTFNQILL